jgi:hypothetical protein
VVSPRCRGWHRFVSGNVRVASQAGWCRLPSLDRCPWAARTGWMATGSPRDRLATSVAHDRHRGVRVDSALECGDVVIPARGQGRRRARVHAGVVRAGASSMCTRTWRAGSHRLPAISDRGGPQSRTASFSPCVGDGVPWSANLGLLETPHPAAAPGGNGQPIGRSAGGQAAVNRLPCFPTHPESTSSSRRTSSVSEPAVSSDARGRSGGVSNELTRPSP